MSEKVKEELKELVVYGGLTMIKQRLTVGTWGNISIRDRETGLIYISTSVDGTAVPSIEKAMARSARAGTCGRF